MEGNVFCTTEMIKYKYDTIIFMKHQHETFEDEEMIFLKKAKGKKTWRQFILDLVKYKKKK